jgi:hypothetical protein
MNCLGHACLTIGRSRYLICLLFFCKFGTLASRSLNSDNIQSLYSSSLIGVPSRSAEDRKSAGRDVKNDVLYSIVQYRGIRYIEALMMSISANITHPPVRTEYQTRLFSFILPASTPNAAMRAATTLASIVGVLALAQAGIIPAIKHLSDDPILVVPNNSTNGPVLMVPESTPDGVYDIWLNDADEVVLERLSELLELPIQSQLLQARNKYDCTHVTLVSNNIQRAAYNLGQTCSNDLLHPCPIQSIRSPDVFGQMTTLRSSREGLSPPSQDPWWCTRAMMPDTRRTIVDRTQSTPLSTFWRTNALRTVLVSRDKHLSSILRCKSDPHCIIISLGEYTFSKNQDPNGNGVRTYGYTAKGNDICYGQTA